MIGAFFKLARSFWKSTFSPKLDSIHVQNKTLSLPQTHPSRPHPALIILPSCLTRTTSPEMRDLHVPDSTLHGREARTKRFSAR